MADVTLTKAQQAAVDSRGSRILVSAAAGSGKTKVLVDRLMGYICDPKDPANVDEFLIITYTKAAAAELRGKISAALAARLAKDPENRHLQKQFSRIYLAKISTVHSFCGDILREYAYRLDIPADFRVADTPECQELRQRAMDQVLEDAYAHLDEDPNLQVFFETLGAGRNDRVVPEIVAQVYDAVQCHLNPQAFADRCQAAYQVAGISDLGETIWGKYLMDDLGDFLAEQQARFEGLATLAAEDEGLAPKVAPMLRDISYQLAGLRNLKTWDEISAAGMPDIADMPRGVKPKDPELRDRIKKAKEKCKKKLQKKMETFTDSTETALKDLAQTGAAVTGIFRLVEEFAKVFRGEKARRRVLDFSDLEHLAVRLLLGKEGTAPTAAAREIGGRFREVMVDEYQDSNSVQDGIFSALTWERRNCFMVGDVKQSIYRFRLADPSIFLKKYEDFKPCEEAEPEQDRKILLSENFRSGGAVLSAVNDVFACAMTPRVGGLYYGPAEALKEGVPHRPLGQPEVELHCITYESREENKKYGKYDYEADFAAERVQELLSEENYVRDGENLRRIRPEDIVILLRSPATAGRYFADALVKRGIPCVTGARGNILQTAEVQSLLALLRVIDNPRQDISLIAAMASPVFCFTADRLAVLRAAHKKDSIYDCLCLAAEADEQDAAEFLEILRMLRKAARQKTLAELVEEIFHRTKLDAVFGAMPDGQKRRENLRYFYQAAADYENRGRKDLSQFLSYLDTLGDKGLTPEEGNAGKQAVTIMSIHKSKGLEFPVVILGNLSGGFNRENLYTSVQADPELGLGCQVVDPQNRVRYPSVALRAIALKAERDMQSEELRVLYVAMTRAKDRLIMLYTSKYLKNDLLEIAQDMTLPRCEYLSQTADCLGHWVLMQAVTRTEAGELHGIAGRPEMVEVREIPWLIRAHQGEIHCQTAQAKPGKVLAEIPDGLREKFAYVYPHMAATKAASKLTATQMKGRTLDQEAAEQTLQPQRKHGGKPRYPDFSEERPLDSRQAGTATHLAMQFLRYEACGTVSGVQKELERLVSEEYLTRQQVDAVAIDQILAFFETPLGKRLMTGENVLREFKFSVLQEAGELDPNLTGEHFLLQGVVDCCLMEPEGMTILDFKTDRVKPGQEGARAGVYAPQVQTYGKALTRIFGLPVKRLFLYFFQTGEFAEIPAKE